MSQLDLLRQAIELAEQLGDKMDMMPDKPDRICQAMRDIEGWLEFRLYKAEGTQLELIRLRGVTNEKAK